MSNLVDNTKLAALDEIVGNNATFAPLAGHNKFAKRYVALYLAMIVRDGIPYNSSTTRSELDAVADLSVCDVVADDLVHEAIESGEDCAVIDNSPFYLDLGCFKQNVMLTKANTQVFENEDDEQKDDDYYYPEHTSYSAEHTRTTFSATSVRIANLNMKCMYKSLVAQLSIEARNAFNNCLRMNPADLTSLCWALKMGHASMLTVPFTDKDFAEANAVSEANQIDPYSNRVILADTIVSRIMAQQGYTIYCEPGTGARQVLICKIGAVISHVTHNVAFGVEENYYQLETFARTYATDHSDIVDVVRARMSVLPDYPEGVDGVFMKYRPKRATVTLPDGKSKDFDRFTVVMRKHGSYADLEISLPKCDLQSLAMADLSNSPMALFSVMAAGPAAKILDDFKRAANAVIRRVPFASFDAYYSAVSALTLGDTGGFPDKIFGMSNLTEGYAAVVATSVIPVVAKDKGIRNNIQTILNPYACSTLQLATALHCRQPSVFTSGWHVYCAGDVAVMLNLRVLTHDERGAPAPDGTPVRGYQGDSKVVLRESKLLSDKGVLFYSYVTPQVTGGCYIDLAFNGQRYQITDSKVTDKAREKGRRTTVDYFVHDYKAIKPCHANLIIKTSSGFKARFDAFVVYCPLNQLTPAYCKALFGVYDVAFCLGTIGMNYGGYLVGTVGQTKHNPAHFGNKCAHVVSERTKLYTSLYSGAPSDVRKIVEAMHGYLEHSSYVTMVTNNDDDKVFLGSFGRRKRVAVDPTAVVALTGDVDLSTLTTDIDDDLTYGFDLAD